MRATSFGVLPWIQARGFVRNIYYPMDPHVVPSIKGMQVARGKAGTRPVPRVQDLGLQPPCSPASFQCCFEEDVGPETGTSVRETEAERKMAREMELSC